MPNLKDPDYEDLLLRCLRLYDGRHAGSLLEQVFFTDGDYLAWLRKQPVREGYEDWHKQAAICKAIFDAQPFTCSCAIKGCSNKVTRSGLFNKSAKPSFYCDSHSPEDHGAEKHFVKFGRTYNDALDHGNGQKLSHDKIRSLIRSIVTGKGITGPFTEEKVARFFYER